MSRWIKRRTVSFESRYEWRFYYLSPEQRGSFYAFDCDQTGKLANPQDQVNFDELKTTLIASGHRLQSPRIVSWEQKEVDQGLLQCDCGKEIPGPYGAHDFECPHCKALYNCSGQRLADPYYWGEETGETFTYPNWSTGDDHE